MSLTMTEELGLIDVALTAENPAGTAV